MTARTDNFTKRRPRRNLEGPVHSACLNYLRLALPGAAIHHSPNELDLGGDPKAKKIAQAKAKARGMQPGWPDIEVIWRGQFWTFEVKAGRNKPAKEQVQCGEAIIAAGGRWAVARSVDDVVALVRQWKAEAGLCGARDVPFRGVVS